MLLRRKNSNRIAGRWWSKKWCTKRRSIIKDRTRVVLRNHRVLQNREEGWTLEGAPEAGGVVEAGAVRVVAVAAVAGAKAGAMFQSGRSIFRRVAICSGQGRSK